MKYTFEKYTRTLPYWKQPTRKTCVGDLPLIGKTSFGENWFLISSKKRDQSIIEYVEYANTRENRHLSKSQQPYEFLSYSFVVFVPFVFPSENSQEQLGDQVLFHVNLGHCADGWVDAKPDDAEHAFARIKFHSQQRGLRQTTFWGVSQRELTSSASTLS